MHSNTTVPSGLVVHYQTAQNGGGGDAATTTADSGGGAIAVGGNSNNNNNTSTVHTQMATQYSQPPHTSPAVAAGTVTANGVLPLYNHHHHLAAHLESIQPNTPSTINPLRQIRKRDTNVAVAQGEKVAADYENSQIARVPPHNHFPARPLNDYHRYSNAHYNSDYSTNGHLSHQYKYSDATQSANGQISSNSHYQNNHRMEAERPISGVNDLHAIGAQQAVQQHHQQQHHSYAHPQNMHPHIVHTQVLRSQLPQHDQPHVAHGHQQYHPNAAHTHQQQSMHYSHRPNHQHHHNSHLHSNGSYYPTSEVNSNQYSRSNNNPHTHPHPHPHQSNTIQNLDPYHIQQPTSYQHHATSSKGSAPPARRYSDYLAALQRYYPDIARDILADHATQNEQNLYLQGSTAHHSSIYPSSSNPPPYNSSVQQYNGSGANFSYSHNAHSTAKYHGYNGGAVPPITVDSQPHIAQHPYHVSAASSSSCSYVKRPPPPLPPPPSQHQKYHSFELPYPQPSHHQPPTIEQFQFNPSSLPEPSSSHNIDTPPTSNNSDSGLRHYLETWAEEETVTVPLATPISTVAASLTVSEPPTDAPIIVLDSAQLLSTESGQFIFKAGDVVPVTTTVSKDMPNIDEADEPVASKQSSSSPLRATAPHIIRSKSLSHLPISPPPSYFPVKRQRRHSFDSNFKIAEGAFEVLSLHEDSILIEINGIMVNLNVSQQPLGSKMVSVSILNEGAKIGELAQPSPPPLPVSPVLEENQHSIEEYLICCSHIHPIEELVPITPSVEAIPLITIPDSPEPNLCLTTTPHSRIDSPALADVTTVPTSMMPHTQDTPPPSVSPSSSLVLVIPPPVTQTPRKIFKRLRKCDFILEKSKRRKFRRIRRQPPKIATRNVLTHEAKTDTYSTNMRNNEFDDSSSTRSRTPMCTDDECCSFFSTSLQSYVPKHNKVNSDQYYQHSKRGINNWEEDEEQDPSTIASPQIFRKSSQLRPPSPLPTAQSQRLHVIDANEFNIRPLNELPTSWELSGHNSLQEYKEVVDSKLSTLTINVPRLNRRNGLPCTQLPPQQKLHLLEKFLSHNGLQHSNTWSKVKNRIIEDTSRLVSSPCHYRQPAVLSSPPYTSSCRPKTKLKQRFRNLHDNSDEEGEEKTEELTQLVKKLDEQPKSPIAPPPKPNISVHRRLSRNCESDKVLKTSLITKHSNGTKPALLVRKRSRDEFHSVGHRLTPSSNSSASRGGGTAFQAAYSVVREAVSTSPHTIPKLILKRNLPQPFVRLERSALADRLVAQFLKDKSRHRSQSCD